MDRHSGLSPWNPACSALRLAKQTHILIRKHTQKDRETQAQSHREYRVRGRENKQKYLEKEQEWLWGKTLVADGQEVETEAHPPEPRNLWSL